MAKITLIKDLRTIDKRYNVKVRIDSTRSDVLKKERQEGVMSDRSGTIDFVVWADSGKRYLYEGKSYIINNVKFAVFNQRLQLQIDKSSQVTSEEQEIFKEEIKNLEAEKREVAKQKYEIDKQIQDIDREKENITMSREQTLESIKLLENKKNEIKQEKMLVIMGYMLFIVVILAGGVSLYDFAMNRVIPKVNDIIELTFNNERIPFKVIKDDQKTDTVTLESIDEYKEQVRFRRPLYLEKPEKEHKKELEQHKSTKKAKVYSFDVKKNKEPVSFSKPKPIVAKKTPKPEPSVLPPPPVLAIPEKPAVSKPKPKAAVGRIVYINSEQDDSVLMALPNIGPKRIEKLKSGRPYRNLEDILNAKIGIGKFWIEKWKDDIKRGRIVFD